MNNSNRNIITWCFYSGAALLFFILQNMVLTHISIRGVHPFILPCIAVIPASLEPRKYAIGYCFILGLLCDLALSDIFPCFYALVFVCSAWFASLVSKRVIMPGTICSFAISAVSFLIMDTLRAFYYIAAYSAHLSTVATIFILEMIFSLIFVPLIHKVDYRIYQRISQG